MKLRIRPEIFSMTVCVRSENPGECDRQIAADEALVAGHGSMRNASLRRHPGTISPGDGFFARARRTCVRRQSVRAQSEGVCRRECATVQLDCRQTPTSLIALMIGAPASKQGSERRRHVAKWLSTRSQNAKRSRRVFLTLSSNATHRLERRRSGITVMVRTWEPTTSESARPKGPCTVRLACCRERRNRPQ